MITIDGFDCTFTDAISCPDCNADKRAIEIAPSITVLQIFHDDTCPTYLHMEASA